MQFYSTPPEKMDSYNQEGYAKRFVETMDSNLLFKVVAHRGFHDCDDQMDRPLENTEEAFLKGWEAGFHCCECDVTHSSDGEIVFSHDETFERLAKVKDELHKTQIEDLSFQQLTNIELKDGSSILTLKHLFDVMKLRNKGGLIVEVKKTVNPSVIVPEIVKCLKTFSCPEEKVPVIMSFKPQVVFQLKHQLGNTGPKVMLLLELIFDNDPVQYISPRYKFSEELIGLDLVRDDFVDFVKDKLLVHQGVKLDGLYLAFDERMISADSIVRNNMIALCKEVTVGVFFPRKKRAFDNGICRNTLHQLGVSYLNTDVPRDELNVKL